MIYYYHPLVIAARHFAIRKHAGQVRKYTGDSYWTHCHSVAMLVKEKATPQDGRLEILMAAAYLHDTIEDTGVTSEDIAHQFPECHQLVCGLTDYYTPKQFPNENRAWRKEKEAIRLGQMADIIPGLRLIKWCDLIDNTHSIVEHDPKFAIIYLREKAFILEQLGFGK